MFCVATAICAKLLMPELSSELWFPIALTLKACAGSLVLFIVAALPLAYYCARRSNVVSRVVLFASTLLLIFPPVALGYLLLLLLGIEGPLGAPLHELFDVRIIFSQTAVVMAVFIAGLPLVVRPIKIAFESRTLRELEDVARLCGARAPTIFLTVTLPTVRNAVLSAFLLGTARASGEVGITMMIGGNVADRTNTLSLEIFNAVGRGDFDAATFLCVILAVLALGLYCLLEILRRKAQI